MSMDKKIPLNILFPPFPSLFLVVLGRVGRTFRVNPTPKTKELEFDPDSLAYGEYGAEEEGPAGKTYQTSV